MYTASFFPEFSCIEKVVFAASWKIGMAKRVMMTRPRCSGAHTSPSAAGGPKKKVVCPEHCSEIIRARRGHHHCASAGAEAALPSCMERLRKE